jgi:hypothetical protein
MARSPGRSFWTTGKIVAAAIGAAAVLAAAIVLAVVLTRGGEPPPTALPPSTPEGTPATKVTPATSTPEGLKVLATAGNKKVTSERRGAEGPPEAGRAAAIANNVDRGRARPRRRKRRRAAPGPGAGDRAAAGAPSRSRGRRRGPTPADEILATGRRGRRTGVRPAARGKLPGKLSREQVKATMQRALVRVAHCYDRHGERGIVRVQVKVHGNGRPRARIVGTFSGRPTGYCVLAAVNRLRFPRFSGRPITFVYPFQLR